MTDPFGALYDSRGLGVELNFPSNNLRQHRTDALFYRRHRVDGKWRIYDVGAETISLVNDYRSQFNRVIARSSFDETLENNKTAGELNI